MTAFLKKKANLKMREPIPEYTVMIVDNESCGLDKMKKMLEKAEVKVIYTFIQSAFGFLNIEVPNLLLLNSEIDKKIGYKIINFIKRRHSDLPIVIITSDSLALSREALLRLGVRDFLSFPFDINMILTKIRSLLKNKEGENG